MVTEKMRQAGDQMASVLIGASISKEMEGIGGAKGIDEFLDSCLGDNRDLVKKYINGEIDSVTAIYIAMNRASDSKKKNNE